MTPLPLYPTAPRAPVEDESRLVRDVGCRRCALGGGPATCASADGEAGGLLVVANDLGAQEAKAGRPLLGAAGAMVRKLVDQHWTGPVAYTSALLCGVGGKKRKTDQLRKSVEACRGYLAQTLDEVRPSLVVVLGSMAAHAVLGRYPDPLSVQGGNGWLSDGVPVVFFQNPHAIMANRFLRAKFEEDFARALGRDDYGDPPWGARPPGGSSTYSVVDDGVDAVRAADELLRAGRVVVDVETAGILHEPGLFQLLCVGVKGVGAAVSYVWSRSALADRQASDTLRRVLRVAAVTQGGKFDLEALRMSGYDLPNLGADTMLMRRLVDAESDAHLEVMADLVGMGGHKEEAQGIESEALAAAGKTYATSLKVVPPLKSGGKRPTPRQLLARADKVAEVELAGDAVRAMHPIVRAGLEAGWSGAKYGKLLLPEDVLHRYCALDVETTDRVLPWVEARLAAEPGIQFVWDDVLSKATRAFARMEEWGVAADRDAIERVAVWLDVQQREQLGRLKPHADINWRSAQQVGKFLFEDLGLRPAFATPSGQWATDEKSLEKIKGKHPAVADLGKLRTLDKMRGTYADGGHRVDAEHPFQLGVDGLIRWVLSDGRFHSVINITGTETGRVSGQDPNLLNQPRAETPVGKMIRDCFVAPPGRWLVEFDRSQIEVRVLAALSGDPVMRQIFVDGRDVYLETAKMISWVWGKQPTDITKEGQERQDSKVVVLSLAYQKGPRQLAEDLGCGVDHATNVSNAILGKYVRFATWCQEQKRQVLATGQVRTRWRGRWARRRWLRDAGWAGEENNSRVEEAKRCAVNTPPQGGANEFTLAAVIDVVNWVEGEGVDAKVVLSVYDSIMLEVGEAALAEVLHVVPRIMGAYPLEFDVPLVTDAKVGRSWGSMAKVALR